MSANIAPADGSLEGVLVASSAIATVDGRAGIALVRGYLLPELAEHCTYEAVAHLVLRGELTRVGDPVRTFADQVREGSVLSPTERATARALAHGNTEADALAAAMILTDDLTARSEPDESLRTARVLGRVASVCAAVAGFDAPDPAWSYARRAAAALGAKRVDPAALRALEVLLCLEAEHGLSASTFACRVAASSGANAGPSLAAAVATLSGERHGGATAQARAMLEAARDSGDPQGFVRQKCEARERLPGFGHRVYKVADPRVVPLRAAMRAMGDAPLLDVVELVAQAAEPLLAPKGIYPNIDLYGAALLTTLDVDPSRYVAAFTLGIACGWLAHWSEVRASGRLVRPDSVYTGPAQRSVV
ncbi:MAG: citrate/2-methylcitrate synthase [Deltaproteobacteria bacterium]|nr:citrate/2-methylcitrate synthase [Deltaproteobacteria bacterium]